jgi:hypothetical protein
LISLTTLPFTGENGFACKQFCDGILTILIFFISFTNFVVLYLEYLGSSKVIGILLSQYGLTVVSNIVSLNYCNFLNDQPGVSPPIDSVAKMY